MKKFITSTVITASFIYYAFMPFLVVRADVIPFGATSTNGVTTGTSAGTTIPWIPVTPVATDTVISTLSMRITAYTSVPEETDDTPFITADGTHTGDGIAASNILPFGTQIKIPSLFGDKIFTIHDRMSTRIKNTIDIWMPTVRKAIVFGAEHAEILILGNQTSTDNLAVAK